MTEPRPPTPTTWSKPSVDLARAFPGCGSMLHTTKSATAAWRCTCGYRNWCRRPVKVVGEQARAKVNSNESDSRLSFPLDGGGRLVGEVVEHASYARNRAHLAHYLRQQILGHSYDAGGHAVDRIDGPQHQRIRAIRRSQGHQHHRKLPHF